MPHVSSFLKLGQLVLNTLVFIWDPVICLATNWTLPSVLQFGGSLSGSELYASHSHAVIVWQV